jgi:hypothetical protein
MTNAISQTITHKILNSRGAWEMKTTPKHPNLEQISITEAQAGDYVLHGSTLMLLCQEDSSTIQIFQYKGQLRLETLKPVRLHKGEMGQGWQDCWENKSWVFPKTHKNVATDLFFRIKSAS